MAMIFNEPNKLYCTHCMHSYPGGPTLVYHPMYDNLAQWDAIPSELITKDPDFLNRLKSCPHAGRFYAFPEAKEL